jgi:chemotaxis signal transduction protein/HPt (histidine-containing phosphotransfer) domain-containing protein
MSEFGDLIPEFVEESLEHLKNIEEDIIIIEQGTADNELINRVFRAVHSIKGGSSFLGLKNIEKLSHKMEDIFNLVRNNELVFNSEISSSVLKSIDKLKEMLEDSEESDNYDIKENLRELKKCLESKPVDKIAEKVKEDIEEATVKIDKHTFDSLRKQGKKVYLVQFELMDESLGGKNPLDFFSEIEKTGEILARNVDMELVLKDDTFTGEGIPMGVIYATVLEKDLVAHIFGIDEKSVKEVKPNSMEEAEVIEDVLNKDKGRKDGYIAGTNPYHTRQKTGEPKTLPKQQKQVYPQPKKQDFDYPGDDEFDDEISVREKPVEKDRRELIKRIEPDDEEQPDETQTEGSGEGGAEEIIESEEEEDEEEDLDIIREVNEYLTFLVGDEEYGIGITQVHEIVTLHTITPLPHAEEFTKGIINLRGDIIPVFDFRLKLKFEERPYDQKTIILIVVVNSKKMGVIVDRVSEVIHFNRKEITDAPQIQQIPSNYVIGIGQKDGKFIILLKLREIFRIEEAA